MCRSSPPSFRTVCCREVRADSTCSGWVVYLSPQHVELDLDAQKSLQNSVMQIARNPRTFRLNRARAQMAQQENIFEGWH